MNFGFSNDTSDWDEFGGENAITTSNFVRIEKNAVYPAIIVGMEAKTLPRKEGKPLTKILTYELALQATDESGQPSEVTRRLRDVWIMAGQGDTPPDYSALFSLARMCMDEEYNNHTDDDLQPIIDEDRPVQWWAQAVVGHRLYGRAREGKPYEKDGEIKRAIKLHPDGSWPDGPRPSM